jgi:hypothetical protein
MFRIFVNPDITELRQKMRKIYLEEQELKKKKCAIFVEDIDKKNFFKK